jgi:hypothetical protein
LDFGRACPGGLRQPGQLRPRDNQTVVGERFLRPFPALAGGIESIGEIAGDFGQVAELSNQHRRAGFTLLVEALNQVLRHFPHLDPVIGRRVPVGRQLITANKPHFPGPRGDDPRFDQPIDGGVLCLAQGFGVTKGAFVHAVRKPNPIRLIEIARRTNDADRTPWMQRPTASPGHVL